jgi:hypothetical protein
LQAVEDELYVWVLSIADVFIALGKKFTQQGMHLKK